MLDVNSPFDGKLIKQIPLNSQADAEGMLDAALEVYQNRDNWLPAHQRIAILNRVAARVSAEAEKFAGLIALEGGKPLLDARIEVARAVDGIYLAAKELSRVVRGEQIPMELTPATQHRQAFTHYEPIGVVLALSAFNHPLNLIVHQVIPAVAVGCPVIVKPAATTPLSCLALCELLQEEGLPERWCQPIVCDNDVAEFMATSTKIAFMTFIGSARVGWMLKSKLAAGVRCALEHGGAAPVIVHHSAELDRLIPALTKGGYYHAGQVCVSVQRVYVPTEMAQDLLSRLSESAQKLVVGDATQAETEVGPLILPREVNRVHEWVTEAVNAGAELVCGGQKLAESLYAPTILLNPAECSRVSSEEIFGPVICVYTYDKVEDAITRANSLNVAFQAAVFGNDLAWCMQVTDRLDASAVMVNDHTAFRADWMPFAGRRHSGYGIGGIGYTMHDMVQIKMVVINT